MSLQDEMARAIMLRLVASPARVPIELLRAARRYQLILWQENYWPDTSECNRMAEESRATFQDLLARYADELPGILGDND